jgi:SSS family solute:Na+ symporter
MSERVLNPGIENNDQASLFLATEVFPVWLGGLLLVSGLSATASSGDPDAVTAVTIFLRDVYRMIVGRLPAEESMVLYSRIGIAGVMTVAFAVTIFATSVIDYITLMISTVLTGLFVAAVLGKFWPRATWQGVSPAWSQAPRRPSP